MIDTLVLDGRPPRQRHLRTSREVKRAALEQSGGVQRSVNKMVLELLTERDRTCDSIELEIACSHQSVSSAFSHLRDKGYVFDTGRRAKTRTGRMAVVWRITDSGAAFLRGDPRISLPKQKRRSRAELKDTISSWVRMMDEGLHAEVRQQMFEISTEW